MAWAVLAAAASLAVSAAPASASTFESAANHYRFQYPDAWSQEPNSNVDVAVLGAASGGVRPNVVAQHEREPAARNESAWLLQYVQNSLNALRAQVTLTEVLSPRTFTTASGRLAGDYTFDRDFGNVTLRQRQVYFVSDHYDLTFYLTLTDNASTYASHGASWSQVVDSFAVIGEPAPSLFTPFTVGVIVAAAAGVAGVVLVRRRRAARAAPPPPPAPPVGPAPPPPLR